MKSDEAFRARVMAEDDVDARMALIGAEGFDCSAEEIASLQELTEAELSGRRRRWNAAVHGEVLGSL